MLLWCAPLIYNLQKPSMLSKKYFGRCLGKSFDFKRIFFSLFCSGISAQLKTYAWIISNGKIRSFQQMTMKNFYFDEPGYTFYWFRIATVLHLHCLQYWYGKWFSYLYCKWIAVSLTMENFITTKYRSGSIWMYAIINNRQGRWEILLIS